MRRMFLACIAVLLLGSCANASSGGATTQVGLLDNGHTITVHLGDTLRITLPPKGNATWDVYDFPRSALHLESAELATGVFTFTVDGTSGGKLIALFGQPCGPAVVGANSTLGCASGGKQEPIDPVAGHIPAPDVFSVTIVVSAAT